MRKPQLQWLMAASMNCLHKRAKHGHDCHLSNPLLAKMKVISVILAQCSCKKGGWLCNCFSSWLWSWVKELFFCFCHESYLRTCHHSCFVWSQHTRQSVRWCFACCLWQSGRSRGKVSLIDICNFSHWTVFGSKLNRVMFIASDVVCVHVSNVLQTWFESASVFNTNFSFNTVGRQHVTTHRVPDHKGKGSTCDSRSRTDKFATTCSHWSEVCLACNCQQQMHQWFFWESFVLLLKVLLHCG